MPSKRVSRPLFPDPAVGYNRVLEDLPSHKEPNRSKSSQRQKRENQVIKGINIMNADSIKVISDSKVPHAIDQVVRGLN
jgi:hypothetical protein